MNPSNNRAVAHEPSWRKVCQAGDLVADSGVVVWHDGEQVALFYLPGQGCELYAVGNRDPRSGANIIGRGLVGDVQGALVVAAPLYKQHFCLQSGVCLEDPSQHLRVWPVRLADGAVQLATSP
ncbi:nitrite reductase small subunit NirD [Pseudomonas sp. GD03858]|uniref:nitrite reductase small subunit NirD n=1 Tax=unclassified Pseudomonas TaxID=196821 RepID=UPI00244A79D5|nr:MULTISPECIES: nitrite reductase small subunit NirD [unclassified Pseudomonas]MDH0647583.1 nitrite reductase small subunit NirD [Pseudomonas sp. GD03867]MDH0662534.1 nitrite reductase small subunit NirD [Pseudomonas sp. GD03858]